MSLRSANFASPPVLTQDSQGPQTVAPDPALTTGPDSVHRSACTAPRRRWHWRRLPPRRVPADNICGAFWETGCQSSPAWLNDLGILWLFANAALVGVAVTSLLSGFNNAIARHHFHSCNQRVHVDQFRSLGFVIDEGVGIQLRCLFNECLIELRTS